MHANCPLACEYGLACAYVRFLMFVPYSFEIDILIQHREIYRVNQKIMVSIFLTLKATISDTHGMKAKALTIFKINVNIKALHSEKFPNFDNRTFPKLAKTKSSENPV